MQITSTNSRPWSNSMLLAPKASPSVRQQLEEDLARFPEPWLDFLDRQGVRVAVLEPGQTLLDSPALKAKATNSQALEPLRSEIGRFLAEVPEGMESRMALTRHFHEALQAASSSLRTLTHGRSFSLDELAEHRQIAAEHRLAWERSFLDFNRDWLRPEGSRWTTSHGVCFLPPVPTPWGAIGDRDYQEAACTRAEDVADSLGLNRGADRLVLLHPRYLAGCAPEIGHYRVAVHELGHALDYALEGLPQSSGYGALHRQRVHQLFEQARQRGDFLSDRADDSPREYFAEVVEAYLTEATSGFDFRPENHREALQQRDPEAYRYLREVLQSLPGQNWVSQAPPPVGVPEGFPDPDRDPIYWD